MKTLFTSLKLTTITLFLALLGNVEVVAQDFSGMFYSGVMTKVIHKQQMKAVYGQDVYQKYDSKNRKQLSTKQRSQPQSSSRKNTRRPTPRPQIQSLAYRPNPGLTQSGKAAFIKRVMNHNPKVGQQLAALMQQNDFLTAYRSAVKPYGLEVRNPAHSLAAYKVLAWMIANGPNQSPERAAVHAVSRRTELALKADPIMATASNRQILDEELMYLFVNMYAGWESARTREGAAVLKQYRNSVNQLWKQQFGQDLRQLALTQQGFQQR